MICMVNGAANSAEKNLANEHGRIEGEALHGVGAKDKLQIRALDGYAMSGHGHGINKKENLVARIERFGQALNAVAVTVSDLARRRSREFVRGSRSREKMIRTAFEGPCNGAKVRRE